MPPTEPTPGPSTATQPSSAHAERVDRLRQYLLLVLALLFMYIAFVRSVDMNWGPRTKECLLVGGRFPYVRWHMGAECFVGGRDD